MLIISFYMNELLKKKKLLADYKFGLAKYLVIRKKCDNFLGLKVRQMDLLSKLSWLNPE